MKDLPTRMSERFALVELIGRGTCSDVFRARDRLLDRDVAVKIFPVAADPRVEREVSLLASLDHPALVPVYDLGEVDGRAFVVMALFEAGNLADRLEREGPLDLTDVLLSTAALADALAHVHRAGVLHRDVIPRNVLFDADGRAHLSDFGVALVADAPRITDTGIVVGAAPYLAPEQVRGDRVGPTADVYSLGLVMIEALTGRRVYEGAPLEAAEARLRIRPTIPLGLRPEVALLLDQMTADDPEARPDAETVCLRLRREALAVEVAEGDPRTDAVEPPLRAAAVAAAGRGPAGHAGRGALVLGAAIFSIMLAGGVVIASTTPVQSVTATTPPNAALIPPAVTGPPVVGNIASGSGPQDSTAPAASGSSGSTDRSGSWGSEDESVVADGWSRTRAAEPREAHRAASPSLSSSASSSSASSSEEGAGGNAPVTAPRAEAELPSIAALAPSKRLGDQVPASDRGASPPRSAGSAGTSGSAGSAGTSGSAGSSGSSDRSGSRGSDDSLGGSGASSGGDDRSSVPTKPSSPTKPSPGSRSGRTGDDTTSTTDPSGAGDGTTTPKAEKADTPRRAGPLDPAVRALRSISGSRLGD